MAKIIRHREVIDDHWQVLTLAAGETPESVVLPAGPVLVPLPVWQVRKAELTARQRESLGVWLGPSDDPVTLSGDLERFSVIGVHFPLASDGRGYSIATLLRSRLGYGGELRAFGAIGRDHLHYLQRVGFDAFVVNQPEKAIASLSDFSEAYQGSFNQPLPLFRRQVLNV